VLWRKATVEQKLAWALAVYCFAVLAVYGWKPVFTNASQPIRGITDPVLALQMVHNIDEVDAVLGDSPSADREVMRIKQYVDFAFIPGYAALAILLGRFVTRARIANILAVAILIASAANVRENLLILKIVDMPISEVTPALLLHLHLTATIKWTLLAVASLLLGYFLLAYARPPRKIVRIAAASITFLGGILTLAGLSANSLLLWGGIILIAGLLLTAAILSLSPHESVT